MSTDLETNLQIIEEFTQRLQVAVIGAEETTDKHVEWVEGPVDGVIQTVNGPLKTLRGQIAEWRLSADQDVASAITGYDAQFTAALAQFQAEFDAYLITVGFEPAVEYAAGILIERRAQTVVFNGVTYYWTATLPYTTTGDFGTEMSWQIAPIVGGIEAPSFTFAGGGKLLRKTQSVLGLDGEWYYWTGTFPKTIAAASTLESAGGVGEDLFKIASGFPPLRPALKILMTSIGMELNAGSFEGGATLTDQDEVLAQFLTGKLYKWNGAFPKVVDLHSTPSSSGGISPTGWSEIENSSNQMLAIEALRRGYAEAGFTLVGGSFETGGSISTSTDVMVLNSNGKAYSWGGPWPHNVVAGTDPTITAGWTLRDTAYLRSQLAAPTGVNMVGGAAKQADLTALETELNEFKAETPITDFSKNAVDSAAANIDLFGRLYARNNIVVIGDSITAGVGASIPSWGWASLFGLSVANYYSQGYRYPLLRNAGLNIDSIYTHSGTVGSAGLPGESISLVGPGQTIAFYASECIGVLGYAEVAAGTASSIQLSVNGTVVATQALSGSVQEFFLTLPKGRNWTSADIVTVNSPSGTLVLTGVTCVRYGNCVVKSVNSSPLVITNGKSGESFEFYRTFISQTAAMSTSFSGVGTSVYIIALGTNSIYNPVQAQTPAAYVASMLGLESQLKALNPNITVVFTIPPQANETMWPVILTAYTYQDYVDAIRAAVSAHKLIDLNIPDLPYSDGVHPDVVGHSAIARRVCEALGVPYNSEAPELMRTAKLTGNSPITINGGYVSRDVHGMKHLAGQILPNGAVNNLLTILPPDYRPSQDRVVSVPVMGGGGGHGVLTINSTTGEVRMDSTGGVIWTSAYLDGVSFF